MSTFYYTTNAGVGQIETNAGSGSIWKCQTVVRQYVQLILIINLVNRHSYLMHFLSIVRKDEGYDNREMKRETQPQSIRLG